MSSVMKEWDEIKQKYQEVWGNSNQAVGGSGSGRVEPLQPTSIIK